MLKKLSFIAVLLTLSTSVFAAKLSCQLWDGEVLVRNYSAQLDTEGNATIETDKYDLFWFGSSVSGGNFDWVWSMSEGDIEEGKSFEPMEITETSSRGTLLTFVCDINN